MTTPLVNVGGQYPLSLNVDQMLPLPAKTPFGNLALKWSKIIGRLVRLNREIATSYGLHAQATSITGPAASAYIEELPHLLEEIAYWLRKTADELIGLSFLCEARLRGEPLPTNIEVDCIGALLAGKHPALLTKYSAHVPHLRSLNDVSNAYKHSFINTYLNIMGRHEPVLYALALQRTNLSKPESFVGIALGEIVRSFDAFFQDAKSYLASWPDPHLTKRWS